MAGHLSHSLPIRKHRYSVLTSRLILLLFGLILVCGRSLGQSGRVRPDAQSDQPIRLRTEEVLLPVSVKNDYGKLPGALTVSDFIVVEDNSRRTVTGLMHAPASIVLIVDSCVEFGKFKQVNLNRDAAIAVIDAIGADDKAAVLTYADKVRVLSGLTGDKDALKLALTQNFKLGTKSHLYDSLLYAANNLLANTPGRHSVVVLTDGYDDFPRNVLDQASQALARARATVYIIDQSAMIVKDFKPVVYSKHPVDLLNMGVDQKYRQMIQEWRQYISDIENEVKTMNGLAEDSGGAFWNPADAEEFHRDWSSLISAIGSEYVIAYRSEREVGDKSLHELKIYPNRPGLTVSSRHAVY